MTFAESDIQASADWPKEHKRGSSMQVIGSGPLQVVSFNLSLSQLSVENETISSFLGASWALF